MSESSSLLVRKVLSMLMLQDEMNSTVDSNWRAHQREWYRAIWIECAELMEHYGGWKWWKHSTQDIEQSVLEVVDIWHFGLSLLLNAEDDVELIARRLAEDWEQSSIRHDFRAEVERLATAALSEKRFDAGATRSLMACCDRGFDDLYRAYVGKNCLNVFRQDHGYREGTYRKVWNGREDNEVLSDLLRELDPDSPDFRQDIYAALNGAYRQTEPNSEDA